MRVLLLCVCASARLRAQCPDGTPPPCRSARLAAAPSPNSVAVLYFDNLSRDSNDLYLADGLTEEVITRLSGIQRITVLSRHLVRRFRGSAMSDPAAVGRALNVTYLVTGSIRRAGNRLRVSAELVRANGGAQVWGQQFDQAGGDVFAIQETVAREVATGIVGRLLPAERQTLAVRPTTSTVAYEEFLRGNYQLARRDSTGILRAVEAYESALRADPAYTDALSRVALAYGIAYANGFDIGLPPDTVVARAVRNADEAVRRAPNSSDAWVALGIARIAADPRGMTAAREALERAIVLDPASAEPHHLLGFTLGMLGNDSAGEAHDRMALAIDPARPVTIMHLAHRAFKERRFDESLRWVDSALTIDRRFSQAHMLRVPLLMQRGDTTGARAEVALWRDIPALRGAANLVELALARPGGDSEQIQRWRRSIAEATPPVLSVPTSCYTAVLLALVARDPAVVMPLLEAGRPRSGQLHYFMTFPVFDPVRSDPRFQALLRETAP